MVTYILTGYKGWYSVRDEAYYTEDETSVGDDGVRVGAQGTPVEWTEEQTYFFKLSAYKDRLIKHYDDNPNFILPKERRNEVVSFVKGGLMDLSISRTTFDWGVIVPTENGEITSDQVKSDKIATDEVTSDDVTSDHIMYVWVDALTNYLTGVGFPDEESESFKKFWPADAHIIGKDILRFHAVYWPAFLMSAGVELPKRIFAHGFLFNKGEKMSKSIGNVIDPFELAEHYGVDQLRYFLLREIPFGKDGNYSHDGIKHRTNADLANDLGNLAQRSLSMIAKNCDGVLPSAIELTDADQEILKSADAMLDEARGLMDRQAIHLAVEAIWNVVSAANRYFAGQEPWAHKKDNPARMGTILYVTAEVIRQVAIMAQPIVPAAAANFLDQLGIPEDARNFTDLGESGRIASGATLLKPEPVFPRYVDEKEES